MTAGIAERLAAAGMSEAESAAKSRLFENAWRAIDAADASPRLPAVAVFVPGRIEVFGKHTDYAGGRSLLCAIERGVCLVARPRPDLRIRITDGVIGETAAFDFDPGLTVAAGRWPGYPMTVARRLARNFPEARTGADIGFVSDLPPAAGMSSSSALLTAVFLVLAALNNLREHEAYQREISTPEDLAGFLGTIENGQSFGSLEGDRGVGTFGGSEDHTAMLCCQAGCLSQYSFFPVRRERVVALPAGMRFVVAVSGVVAEKTGAAMARYNQVSLAARAALELWRGATGRADGSLAEVVASAPDARERMRQVLAESTHPVFPPSALVNRFEQFVSESHEIVPAAAEALARGDLEAVGRLADASQRGAEEWLGTQVRETVALARTARDEGAIAASAFGAGFGGSVWALVRVDEVEAFTRRWETRYRAACPGTAGRARFLASRPGPPAVRL